MEEDLKVIREWIEEIVPDESALCMRLRTKDLRQKLIDGLTYSFLPQYYDKSRTVPELKSMSDSVYMKGIKNLSKMSLQNQENILSMLLDAAKSKLFGALRLGHLEGKKVAIYIGLEDDIYG